MQNGCSDCFRGNELGSLEVNGRIVLTEPMHLFFFHFLKDIIHHRGQLTTYYRNMGCRNPSIYGPAAEDIEDRIVAMIAEGQEV